MKKKFIISVCFMWILSALVLAAPTGSTDSTGSSSDTTATNMVVDFTSTSFDSEVGPGDSGVLNLVIKNNGGRKADNVQIIITSNAIIRTDKSLYIGRVEPGESKTMPVIFSVAQTVNAGLTAIPVKISYNGFKSDGSADSNKLTTWEIPLRVVGNPVFQINPAKTTYYLGTTDELVLEVYTRENVRDLEATLSSSCVVVMGSSREYVGEVGKDQRFNISYSIKPTSTGACVSSLRFSYSDKSGSKSSNNLSIGINVEDGGINFKITNVSYTQTGPGEETEMKITFVNVGNADADAVTLYLDLSSPFVPVTTSEKYFQKIQAGEKQEADFKLAVGWDAETKAYSIPLIISYKLGGTSTSVTKNIGIDVTGSVVLRVIKVDASGGNARIDVANIGTRTADGVKATLITSSSAASDQQNVTGRSGRQLTENASQTQGSMRPTFNQTAATGMQRLVSYKSDIKPSKQTTFTFSTSTTGPATLELEYTGPKNERITQTERITLGGSSSGVFSSRTSSRNSGSTGTSNTTTYALGLAVLVIAYLAYRRFKRKK